jgi:hypothetical protein
MVVLGADPDAPAKEDDWEELPSQRFNPRTVGLVHHFGYHPYMRMSQRFNDFDKKILSRTFNLLMKRGYSSSAIREMIDTFWQSWGAGYDEPAVAFVSSTMQEKLTAEVPISTDDIYMEWLVQGMPDNGPVDDPSHIRQAIVLASTDLTHRYPDVVAKIAKLDRGYSISRRLIVSADQLVRWNLGEDIPDFDIYETLDVLGKIDLPPELKTSTRSPSRIRRKWDRLSQAVAHVPIPRKKHARTD